jgi:hypothetical protein
LIEYVFGEVVVVKTGRIARKQSSDSTTKRRPKTHISQNDSVMYEIEPAMGDIKWKKWVKDEDLYVIEQHISPPSVIDNLDQKGDNLLSGDVSINDYVKNMLQQADDDT